MDTRWRLDGDSLDGAGLRVAVQRIGAAHWREQGVLRSWGLAPMHRDGDTLCVPCGDDEVLWIGAWAEPPGGRGGVSLRDGHEDPCARIEVPREQAITALVGGRPIVRTAPQQRRDLVLALAPLAGEPVEIALALLVPADWSALAGRDWAPLAGPPPRPPRLG